MGVFRRGVLMLEKSWRGRFVTRLVSHVSQSDQERGSGADHDPFRAAAARHERPHERLFPYDVVDKKAEQEARRGAAGRFRPTPKPAPAPATADLEQRVIFKKPDPKVVVIVTEKPRPGPQWHWKANGRQPPGQ